MTAPDIAKTAAYSALTLMAMAFGWTGLMLGHHMAFSLGRFDEMVTTVNRPDTGTLAEVDKIILAGKSTLVHADIALAHEDRQLARIDTEEAQLFGDLHTTALSAQRLTGSLTETSQQATASLQSADQALRTMNTTIQAAQPVLATANLAVSHADALVTDPAIKRLLDSTADTTAQVDATATTVNKVTAKIAAPYLNPAPKHWYSYIRPTMQELWEAAMLAK